MSTWKHLASCPSCWSGKLSKWLAHQLPESQRQRYVEAAIYLLSFRRTKTRLNWTLAGDEKRVLYTNSQQKQLWGSPCEPWSTTAKPGSIRESVMLSILWTGRVCCCFQCCPQHQHHCAVVQSITWSLGRSDTKKAPEALPRALLSLQRQTQNCKHCLAEAAWARLESADLPAVLPISLALQLFSITVADPLTAIQNLLQWRWRYSVAGGFLILQASIVLSWLHSKSDRKMAKVIVCAADCFNGIELCS